MIRIMIAAYFTLGIYLGIGTWKESEQIDKRCFWFLAGIILGAIFWPLAIVWYLISEHRKNKEV